MANPKKKRTEVYSSGKHIGTIVIYNSIIATYNERWWKVSETNEPSEKKRIRCIRKLINAHKQRAVA